MECKKCGGRVFVDQLYNAKTFVDLACVMCGKRWHVPRNNPLARLLSGERTEATIAKKLLNG